jgi:excisionase family DNA binding protein
MSNAARPKSSPLFTDGNHTNGTVKLDPESVTALAAALADVTRPDGALLDAEGAAKLLGVPASWILAEARADRVPHMRLGRYVRFDADELRAWASARSRGPRARRTGSRPVSSGGEGQ